MRGSSVTLCQTARAATEHRPHTHVRAHTHFTFYAQVQVVYFEIAGKRCVDLLAPGQREIVLKEEASDERSTPTVLLVGATEVICHDSPSCTVAVAIGVAMAWRL